MTRKKTPQLPASRPDARYEVGYGKPPVESRFKPGQSGNPKGRPKGAKNKRPALNEERLKGIILDEAYREITVRDGNRNVSVPMAQAIVRAMAVNAAKGHYRAQRLFSDLLSITERENKALADEWLQTAIEYKVSWEEELRRREVQGITHLPPPSPHPDQVRIDMNTGLAWVQGPMTKEQHQELALWETRRDSWVAELAALQEDLEGETDEVLRADLEGDIQHAERMLDLNNQLLKRIGF